MKLKHALTAVCLAVILTGCGSTAPAPVGTTQPESRAEKDLREATDLASEWDPINSANINLPDEKTERFSAAQINMVADDVRRLMTSQLEYQQAESQDEVLANIDDLTADAPGLLGESMAEQAKRDAEDKEKVAWALTYVPAIDSTYEIEDGSRSTYGWELRDHDDFDEPGVEVTLFHRTFYKLRGPSGDESFIVVGRWVGLNTVNPSNSHSSGDYAWQLNMHASGSIFCDAVKRSLLVPEKDDSDPQDFRKLMKVEPSSFAPRSDFKHAEGDLKDAKKC